MRLIKSLKHVTRLTAQRFGHAIRKNSEKIWLRQIHARLAREAAQVDRRFEQKLADEGLAADFEDWPEY